MALTKVIGAGLGEIPAISGASLTGFTSSQMPAGSIVQLTQAQLNTQFSTTSTSYVDTGFSGSITPTSSSNKIYIIAGINAYNTAANGVSPITIYRGSTRISDSAALVMHMDIVVLVLMLRIILLHFLIHPILLVQQNIKFTLP